MHDMLSQPPLTDEDAELLRYRLQRDEECLESARRSREQLAAKLASRDSVIDALEEAIHRARRLLGEDGPLLPSAAHHQEMFGGPSTQVLGEVVPSPAREELGDGQPPDGQCIHCGQPVWRVEPSEASPTGYTHGFGATCDPDSADSMVAELGGGS